MDMRRKYVFALLAIGTVLFLFNLGGRDLWEPDETRYAVIAREMRKQGTGFCPISTGRSMQKNLPSPFGWSMCPLSF